MIAKNILIFAISGLCMHLTERRSNSAVLNDLMAADADCKSGTRAANGYDGSSVGSLTVLNYGQSVDKDFQQCGKDANVGPMTLTECQQLIDYTNYTLEPDFKAYLDALISKKSQFASSGFSGTVCNNLKNLKSDVNSCYAAILSVCPAAKASAASAAEAKMDRDIDPAVSAYC